MSLAVKPNGRQSPLPAPRERRQPARVSALREQIARIEYGGLAARQRPVLSMGLPQVDGELPMGGLPFGAVHELSGTGALRFGLLLLARLEAPVLWCRPRQGNQLPYGPALQQAGLATERLLFAFTDRQQDLLWTMEEGLRTGAVAAVLSEPREVLDLTISRRLQLAAETGGSIGLVVDDRPGRRRGPLAPSALYSRWRVTPAPTSGHEHAAWQLELLRCRGGARGDWRITTGETDDQG